MKRATTKMSARRPVPLSARAAAGAFGRSQAKALTDSGLSTSVRRWAPVLLRWARVRVRERPAATARRSVPMQSWASHLHLHFHLALRTALARDGVRGDVTAAARLASGFRHTLALRSGAARLDAAGVALELRRLLERARGSRAAYQGTATSPSMAHAASPTSAANPATLAARALRYRTRLSASLLSPATSAGARGAHRGSAPIAEHALAPTRSGGIIGFSSRAKQWAANPAGLRLHGPTLRAMRAADAEHVPTRDRSSAMSRALAPPSQRVARRRAAVSADSLGASANRPVESTAASKRLQAWTSKRPVDLVWRTNAASTAASDGTASSMTSDSPRTRGAYARTSAAQSPSVETTNVAAAHENARVCATALDPALANRLADDVIRRIDQRARIERERRGH